LWGAQFLCVFFRRRLKINLPLKKILIYMAKLKQGKIQKVHFLTKMKINVIFKNLDKNIFFYPNF